MTTEPHNIGKRLKQWRASQGYNQQELADRLGISQSHLARMEQERRALSGKFIRAVIDKLGLDVLAYIMGLNDFESAQRYKPYHCKLPKDLEPLIENNEGLQDLYNDKDLLARLRVTIDELEMLAGIKMEADLLLTKEFYMDVLMHHRLELANLVKSARK